MSDEDKSVNGAQVSPEANKHNILDSNSAKPSSLSNKKLRTISNLTQNHQTPDDKKLAQKKATPSSAKNSAGKWREPSVESVRSPVSRDRLSTKKRSLQSSFNGTVDRHAVQGHAFGRTVSATVSVPNTTNSKILDKSVVKNVPNSSVNIKAAKNIAPANNTSLKKSYMGNSVLSMDPTAITSSTTVRPAVDPKGVASAAAAATAAPVKSNSSAFTKVAPTTRLSKLTAAVSTGELVGDGGSSPPGGGGKRKSDQGSEAEETRKVRRSNLGK